MIRNSNLCAAAVSSLLLLADDRLLFKKCKVNTPSGVIAEKSSGRGTTWCCRRQ